MLGASGEEVNCTWGKQLLRKQTLSANAPHVNEKISRLGWAKGMSSVSWS